MARIEKDGDLITDQYISRGMGMNFMKQLQEKLLALLLMALLTGTGAYAQEALDKQKTPDYRFAVRTNVLYLSLIHI